MLAPCPEEDARRSSRVIKGGAQILRKHDISSVIGGEIVAELPNARQQNQMRIPCHPQVHEVADRLISASSRDNSLLCEAPEYLCDLKVQEVRRVQSLATRIDALLNSLSGRCLQKPVNCSGRI